MKNWRRVQTDDEFLRQNQQDGADVEFFGGLEELMPDEFDASIVRNAKGGIRKLPKSPTTTTTSAVDKTEPTKPESELKPPKLKRKKQRESVVTPKTEPKIKLLKTEENNKTEPTMKLLKTGENPPKTEVSKPQKEVNNIANEDGKDLDAVAKKKKRLFERRLRHREKIKVARAAKAEEAKVNGEVKDGKTDISKADKSAKKKSKKKKKKKSKLTNGEVSVTADTTTSSKAVNSSQSEMEVDEDKTEQPDLNDFSDLAAWTEFNLPAPVMRALKSFMQPTDIQRLVLPPAIGHKLDIVGAAETGSGKTLAFGLPIIAGLLATLPSTSSETTVITSTINDSAPSSTSKSTNQVPPPRRIKTNGPLALIVTPTRELAIQVHKHIEAVSKFTDLQSTVIVGGLAQQKQERLLKRRPEILIGTPGRLWALIEQYSNEPDSYLHDLSGIRYLVVDEADRMVEHGHFEELNNILNKVKSVRRQNSRSQTFVFSATLTYVHPAPKRHGQTTGSNLTSEQKLAELMATTGVRPNAHKVIDITRTFGTAESVVETRINCDSLNDKDAHLAYFLTKYPGRTLVFANSIDCTRRLHALLNKLGFSAHLLHAKMHQKQRLKNLERFSETSSSILLATDVAARGLDIRAIQHVVHYQVPKTAEVYVHRSGRTARASTSGISVMLVDAKDAQFYRRICTNLNRNQDLALFPIRSPTVLAIVRARVRCAAELESSEHQLAKAAASKNWFRKAAQDAEIELDPRLGIAEESDSDMSDDGAEQSKAAKMKRRVKQLTSELQQLMKIPIPEDNVAITKYPNEKLVKQWQKDLPDAIGAVVESTTSKHSKSALKRMGVNIGRIKKNKKSFGKKKKFGK